MAVGKHPSAQLHRSHPSAQPHRQHRAALCCLVTHFLRGTENSEDAQGVSRSSMLDKVHLPPAAGPKRPLFVSLQRHGPQAAASQQVIDTAPAAELRSSTLTALVAQFVRLFYTTFLFPHARMHPIQLDEKAGSRSWCSRRPRCPLMTAHHVLQVQPSTVRMTASVMYWKRTGLGSHRIFPACRSRGRSCLPLASVRCLQS